MITIIVSKESHLQYISAHESAMILIDLIFQEERIIKKAEFEF